MNDELVNELLKDELLKRELVEQGVKRTQTNDDPAIQRALDMLNQPLNPISVVDFDTAMKLYQQHGDTLSPVGVENRRKGLEGFRVPKDPQVYVSNSSPLYKQAAREKNNQAATALLAGVLVHEQTHGLEGPEFAPKQKEMDFLISQLERIRSPYQRGLIKARIRQLQISLAPTRR